MSYFDLNSDANIFLNQSIPLTFHTRPSVVSAGETFGIANAEASAVGIPAVGFASCGILESTSANRDLAAWPPSALGLAQSTARLLFAKVCNSGYHFKVQVYYITVGAGG